MIEDAAHAAESAYRGRKIGSIAEVDCFSLYATKNVAAGEGGLISTNDDDDRRGDREPALMRRGDGSLYDIVVPGYKANLSDVLAAIALVQLDKVEQHGEIRRRQFAAYDEAVAELDGIEPLARDDRDTHAYHLYVVRIDAERAGGDARRVPAPARRGEHRTSIHFLPVHTLTAYRERSPISRRCRSPSARAPRCSRCRSRRRTPTTTSRTRSPRCAGSTRDSFR